MWLIMAARVVDFPLLTGPVTMMNPRGLSMSFLTAGGSPRSSSLGIPLGMIRITEATEPR